MAAEWLITIIWVLAGVCGCALVTYEPCIWSILTIISSRYASYSKLLWAATCWQGSRPQLLNPCGLWGRRVIGAARWMGHRRLPMARHRNWHTSLLPIAHCQGDMRCRGLRWVPTNMTRPSSAHVYPSPVYGMDRGLRADLRQRIRLVGGFPRGQQWPWHIDTGQTWEELHWEIARVLRRGYATFRIWHNDEPVDPAAQVPPTRRQHEIQLRRVPPDQQDRSRSRSRDPDWQPVPEDPGLPALQDVQPDPERRARRRQQRPALPVTPRNVHEADRVDLLLRTRDGEWELPVFLEDFPEAQGWNQVTIYDIEQKLLHVYRPPLPACREIVPSVRRHHSTIRRQCGGTS